MYHETVAFPGQQKIIRRYLNLKYIPSVCETQPFLGRMWFSMVFGLALWRALLRKLPFAISAVSNPRVSNFFFLLWPFRWPLCEFLTETVTNLVDRHAHSSRPCPRVKLSRFAPAAEKTKKKTRKTRSTIFVQNPFFFSFKTPPHQASKIFVQNPKIFVQNLDYGAFSRVA